MKEKLGIALAIILAVLALILSILAIVYRG
jgi:hypothetical protein